MKNVNFRVDDTLAGLMDDCYTSKGGAAEKIIPAFFQIRKYTLTELKGIFTREEITALADSLNGTLQDANFQANKGVARAHLQDFEIYQYGVSRHGAALPELLEKIASLTASQVYFLQEEINIMWEKNKQLQHLYDLFV